MIRDRIRLALPLALIVMFAIGVITPHAQTQTDAPHQAWDAGTRSPGWQAPSTLSLVNDCKKDHSFSVTKNNAGFLDFQFTSPVKVPGKKSITVPVLFHTDGMTSGDYTGEVIVQCLDCTEVPPCTQDKKFLAPHIKVVAQAGTQTENQVSRTPDLCHQDCGAILKAFNDAQAKVREQQKAFDAAVANEKATHAIVKEAEKDLQKTTESAWNNFDAKKSADYQKAIEGEQQSLQRAMDADARAVQTESAERAKLDALNQQADTLFKQYQNCLSAIGICKQDSPPRTCTPGNSCTDGWTQCGPGQSCGLPELCTTDHPCTGGSAVTGPPQTQGQTKSPCTQDRDDCGKLRLIAEQKEAEAKAAQEDANNAAAEATTREVAARNTAGKDPRDVIAQKEVARSSRENANNMQKLADAAKADAAAARKASDACLKHENVDCPNLPGQTTDGGPITPPVTGGHPGTTAKPPCPPTEDCEKLRLAWQEGARQYAIAQALADQAARNQKWDESEAAYLDSRAAIDDEYANGQTERAKAYREIAGMAKGLGAKDREIAATYPAGSKDRAAWEKAAKEEDKDNISWNKGADQLEAEEMKYHMKAAEEHAKAAQIRGGSNSAQAEADAARARAAAAKKAYEDCLDRVKRALEECDKAKTSGTPKTTGRGPTTGNPPTGGTQPPTGGGTNPPPTTGGGGTVTGGTTGGNPPVGPPPATTPGTTSKPKKKGKRCEWRTYEVEYGPYTMDSKAKSELLAKVREKLQKFLEKAAPNAAKGLDAVLKGFTITSIVQNVYITYILVEIDLDTGSETVIDFKTITLEDRDAVDFWGKSDSPDAKAGRASTIARNTPKGGCPPGR